MIQLHQYILKIRKEILRNIKILKKYYKHMKSFYYIDFMFPFQNSVPHHECNLEIEFITLQISSLYFIFFFLLQFSERTINPFYQFLPRIDDRHNRYTIFIMFPIDKNLMYNISEQCVPRDQSIFHKIFVQPFFNRSRVICRTHILS